MKKMIPGALYLISGALLALGAEAVVGNISASAYAPFPAATPLALAGIALLAAWLLSRKGKEKTGEKPFLPAAHDSEPMGLRALNRLLMESRTVEELFSNFLDKVASQSLRFPEKVGVKLFFDGRTRLVGTEDQASCLSSSIIIGGQVRGRLSICRPENEPPQSDFEELLVDTYALALGQAVEKMEAEEALYDSREYLGTIISSIPGVVYMCANEPDWPMHFISEAIEKISGYPSSDLVNNSVRSYGSLIHAEDRVRVFDAVQEGVRNREPFQIEYRIRTRDGDTLWVSERGQGHFDDNGKLDHLVGAIFDITKQKKAEERLKQNEERLQAILETVQAGIIIVDVETRKIVTANRYALNALGLSRDQVQGKTCHHFICPSPKGRCPILDDHQTINSTECQLLASKGRVLPILKSAIPLNLGEKTLLLESFVDITLRKEAELKMMQAAEAAESANRMKGEFLANMSHELRTPLNGIFGMLQLASTTDLDPEQREYIETALSAGKGLLTVINDILDFSVMEAGVLQISEQPFDLRETMKTVMLSFRVQAGDKGLYLEHEIDHSVPESLVGDEGRVRQILFNLIGNALKFTNKGGVRVDVSALPDQGRGKTLLLFSVSDTGIGIPDNMVGNVFNAFTQADGSHTRPYSGAGLGLSIVHRLVKVLGGNISVDSEVDVGTAVNFTIEVKTSTTLQPSLAQGKPRPAEEKILNILLAEDDKVNQMAAKIALEKLGHTVTCVFNGREAVLALKEKTYDCILMDIQMPVMNGMEATREIRSTKGSDKATTPIIALTAHAMQGDKEMFLAAGMDGYTQKPFEIDNLAATLATVVGRHETAL